MKKSFCITLSVLTILLCACGRKYQYDIYEYPNVEYYGEREDAVLLKDYASYQEYINILSKNEMSEEFKKKLGSFEETFFESEMLIVIHHWENSGSSTISVKDVKYADKNVEVIIKRTTPSITTADMKDYAIMICVSKNESYTSVEYRVVE